MDNIQQKNLEQIAELLKEMQRTTFEGNSEPEALKQNLHGG